MKKILCLALIGLLNFSAMAQQVLDKVAAIVDNEIISQGELDFQTALFASQRKVDINTPGLKEKILNSMIEDKLVYAQAKLDSIEVTDDEVNQRIDYQINSFIQQYGSKEKVEQVYGMTVEKIKRELKDDVRKNLMVQMLQQKKFGNTEASRREVEEFYSLYKDSLGVIPEKLKISHIYINPKASDDSKKKYYQLAQSLLDSIKNGADFGTLSIKYSEDPGSAASGGDLGFVKKGVFYAEFESAAFDLQPGELSAVVESPVGFHIIQLLERRGESIHTRHILIKIKADDQADLRAIQLLTDLRDSIMQDVSKFKTFAVKYSQDKETAPFGGDLGTYYINQLDKNLLEIVSKMKQGEVSFPRRIEYSVGNYGYHIVYLEEKIPQHPANLEIDYAELKKLADEQKKQKKYESWMAELKSQIFWEVKN